MILRRGGPRAAALALVALASLPLACGGSPASTQSAPPRVVHDDTGADVAIPAKPARIAALAPDLTEIAYSVGAGDAMAGACDPCDWPEPARALPRLGPMIEPSVESILVLRPDLVLATAEGNPLASVRRMRELGIPVVGLRPGRGLAGVASMVRRVGDLTGHAGDGERLASEMESRLSAVRAAARPLPRLKACILVWPDPLVAAGRDAYLTELADAAGADNACAVADGWPTLSREDVLLAQPDVVLLGIADATVGLGAWADSLPAVKRGSVLRLPERPFLRPSAELGRAGEELLAMLAPLRSR